MTNETEQIDDGEEQDLEAFRNEVGKVDWEKVHFAFIYSALQPKQFAHKYGISLDYLKNMASRKWNAERVAITREIEEAAQNEIKLQRAKELVAFNKADLTMAKAIRSMVADRIKQMSELRANNPRMQINANELRALSSVVESAQRVGRLALGMNTDSHEHTGKDGKDLPAPTIVIGGPGEEGEPSGLADPEEDDPLPPA